MLQIHDTFPGPGQHALRVIHLGADGNKPGALGSRHQVHGLSGNAQAALHFRADWETPQTSPRSR